MKQHGEGGQLIGATLTGKTIIIDDVITAGTAFREAQTLIRDSGGVLSGVVIALDRCERGLTEQSTLSEIKAQGIEVNSIINVYDLIDYLKSTNQLTHIAKLEAYQEIYGAL
jgi:orotate phosphoribosyltransferase